MWGLARVLAKFSTKNYHPKLRNLGSPYFLTASLPQINTYIRRYLNISKMKINREKIGPFNFWLLSRPILKLVDYQLEVDKGKLTAVANLKS